MTPAKYAAGARTTFGRTQPVGTALGKGCSGATYFSPWGAGGHTSEANAEYRLTQALSVVAVRIYISARGALGTGSFALRKNGASTAITGSVAATGVLSATGSVAFAAGDRISVMVTNGSDSFVDVDTVEVDY